MLMALKVDDALLLDFVYNDGGRHDAGYTGHTSDCVCRSIAIAAELPYQEVYDALNDFALNERKIKRRKQKSHARTGVHKATGRRFMEKLGWTWVPTMLVGQGCKVHLRKGELPGGRLVVAVSKHYTAVIDGVINDTHNPARDGNRCVYGYYQKK